MKRIQFLSLTFLLVCMIGFCVQSDLLSKEKKKTKKRKPNPAFAKVVDDPKLPRVLLIGDSISIGYTGPTRKLLKGKANLHRNAGNGGPTIRGLEKIDQWLGDKKWDVIHFNWGLHDLRVDNGKTHQVPIDQYEKNLEKLTVRLKKTGAILIWCNTTPVPKGAGRRTAGDELKYNSVAEKIMKKHHIAIHDLHSFCVAQKASIQRPKNVHFTAKGSEVLATQVVKQIEKALKSSKK